VKQTIEHNAAEIRRLHQAIHDTWRRRSESAEAWTVWERACAEMHARYDALAFPGGLSAAFERLAAGDPLTAETAIIFVELRPYFFRSQYHATKLIKLLKRLHLRPDLQQRFDAVLTVRREYKRRNKRSVLR
jgi:hypothetical protein